MGPKISHYVQKSHCFFTKQDAYEIHNALLTGILWGEGGGGGFKRYHTRLCLKIDLRKLT
jgi:hypothetical protein